MIVLKPEEIAACVTRPDGRVYLVAYMSRIGAAALSAAIEWYWYPPKTSRNRFF